jgi:hypothetical protein
MRVVGLSASGSRHHRSAPALGATDRRVTPLTTANGVDLVGEVRLFEESHNLTWCLRPAPNLDRASFGYGLSTATSAVASILGAFPGLGVPSMGPAGGHGRRARARRDGIDRH